MLLKIRFSFSNQKVNLYKQIFNKIETLNCKPALANLLKLKSENMIDIQIWAKVEDLLQRNLTRLDGDDINAFCYLIADNKFVSDRAIAQLEHKVKQNKSTLTVDQLQTIIRKLGPLASESFKSFLVQKFVTTEFPLKKALKCMIVLLECSYNTQLIQKLKEYQDITQLELDIEGLVLYQQIYHSGLIKKFIDKTIIREHTKSQLAEVMNGHRSPVMEINYQDINQIQELDKQISKHQVGDPFKLLLLHLQFITSCQYRQFAYNHNELLQKTLISTADKLTPSEAARILTYAIDNKILTEFIQKYLSIHLSKLSTKHLIELLESNNVTLKNRDIFIKLLEKIPITLEQCGFDQFVKIGQILNNSTQIYSGYVKYIRQFQIEFYAVLTKAIQINSNINFVTALEITLTYTLPKEDLYILWRKVVMKDVKTVKEFILKLRQLQERKYLTEEQANLIVEIIQQQFQLK